MWFSDQKSQIVDEVQAFQVKWRYTILGSKLHALLQQSTHIRILFPRNCSEFSSIQDGRSLYCLISGSNVFTAGRSNFPILVSYKFLASNRIIFLSELFSRHFPGEKKNQISKGWYLVNYISVLYQLQFLNQTSNDGQTPTLKF